MMKRFYLLFFALIGLLATQAQVNPADSAVGAFLPTVSYAYQFAGGDMTKEYGNNSTVGAAIRYKTNRNWLWSVDMNFIFGSDIKNADSILKMVETDNHFIIDGNGTYALYTLYERGYNLTASVGKVLNVWRANPNSGLMLSGGVGLLVHRMKIDNQHRTAPQIIDDYAKGYDRLRAGVSLNEFVGYMYMGKSRLVNFYAGFEFVQGFTTSQRDWIFDLQKKDTGTNLDLFYGFKVGWFLPIYNRAPDPYYYN